MASASLREELNCLICLSTYTNPVTLPCGHTFCKECIGNTWAQREFNQSCMCPECRTRFGAMPNLQANTKMCGIVELFLSTQPHQKDGKNVCTYCVQCLVTASNQCLNCEVSLCEHHLKSHSKSVEHVFTELTTSLESRTCSLHQELLKYYCHVDDTYVCASGVLFGPHEGHLVELLKEVSKTQKAELQRIVEILTATGKETEKRVQQMEGHQKGVQRKAARIRDRVTGLFGDIKREMQTLEHRALREISRQEDQESLRVSNLIRQLEIKATKIRLMIIEVEKLRNITDPISLLEKTSNPISSEDNVEVETTTVEGLDELLIMVNLQSGLCGLLKHIPGLQKERGFNIHHISNITLDVNTASDQMVISDELTHISLWHSMNPSLTELERDEDCVLGHDSSSWFLYLSDVKDPSATHNSVAISVRASPPVKALGIYLDYEAGVLSFYQVSDFVSHLHTFNATFTEPISRRSYRMAWVHAWLTGG
ncbi:hypothetical protein FKM82_007362 [Ascaphus truei]